ncbi:helix-turn-helix domain-containing protein [Dysgonomonas sp. Marseille-P4677]|uniref:helix-turn-helix domain-containing protein n=1 Tax=Dysgonomonas sp. Marseille-P4677 TaxID=2364790 RepID=UPI001911A9AC|nr:helix-turn-helix domain-containing protein [Dysgonomonas sp. Marseille-P4677]MBK5722177.1 helix-turn-helix domain-containing protein [Dysgonomonas sp. Marseille-P4677]
MDLKEILSSGTNVTLAISANDLREWHKEVIADTKRELEKAVIAEKAEHYIDAKQVTELLNIDLSTLWRWEKRKYLIPVKVGGKRRYKMSEVKSLIEGGRK